MALLAQAHGEVAGCWRAAKYSNDPDVWRDLCQLVKEAPSGDAWAHELKFDGYRMHARLDNGEIRLLTRKGLDWTSKYPVIATALRTLPARQAYLDGELCGVRPDGLTSFALIQNAAERLGGAGLVYFVSTCSTSTVRT